MGKELTAAPPLGSVPPRPRIEPEVLRALVHLATVVTSHSGPEALIEGVAEAAMGLLGADSLSISSVDPARQHLTTMINVGELGPGEERWPAEETYAVAAFPDTLGFLAGRSVRRTVTCLDDPDAEAAELTLLRSLGKFCSLKAPIVVDGAMWGELWCSRTAARPRFDSYDADLAEIIVGLVSASVVQASAWQAMQQLAQTDSMTGLSNRRAFDDHLRHHLQVVAGLGLPLALAIGDVNGLKQVNDSRGHAAGDDALIQVARAASLAVREVPGGLAARLGGDEFALVLPRLDSRAAVDVAREWCWGARNATYGTSLACGVAVAHPTTPEAAGSTGGPIDPRDLLHSADVAQYRAKHTKSLEPVLTTG